MASHAHTHRVASLHSRLQCHSEPPQHTLQCHSLSLTAELYAVCAVTIANGQKLELGADGWCLRGFVGSESELRGRLLFATPTGLGLHARLDLGLAAKLLRVRLLGTRTRDLSLCCCVCAERPAFESLS